jgi:polysaccharide pyruvyl transferase CsaB
MKIIHLISGGDVGGAKTHVLSLLERLGKTDEVLLVCFTDGDFADEARSLGIPTEIVSGANPLPVCAALTRRIREGGFEIIHCHGARANMIGAMLQSKLSLPVVTTVHSDYRLDYLGRPLGRLTYGTINSIALRKIPYHIGVSDAMCDLLISRGFDPQTMFAIYNGVDFQVAPPQLSREEYLDSVGVSRAPDSVIFGIAARLNPVKDIATLIRAFAVAVQAVPSCRLIVAGDGELAEPLHQLAAELCPPGSVVFPGWVQDTDSFYNAIDVNLLTSLSETFPYALTEGIRMHCATISSAVGGVPALIEDGVTGLLFQPGDKDALAQHLIRYATEPELRQTMADKLYESTVKRFSIDATVARQRTIYETILRRRARTPGRDGVLICGAYGRGNAGDDAILEAICAQLRSIDPDLPLYVLTRTPKLTAQRYRIGAVYTFNPIAYRKRMRRVKLYISGGGSLIQDVTSSRSLFYYLTSLRSAHRRGCKTLMYGCGIGPVSSSHLRCAGRIINQNADRITLRDAQSPEVLRQMGVTKPEIRVTADPALLLDPAPDAKVDSFLLSHGIDPQGRYLMFALRPWPGFAEHCADFAACANAAYERDGLTPIFVAFEPKRDLPAAQAVCDRLTCPHHILSTPDDGALIVGMMGRMQAVVAMRLHALIFAAGQGVPLVGVVYDPKVSGFLDYLGQSNYQALDALSKASLNRMIAEALHAEQSAAASAARLRALAQENCAAARQLLEDAT